MRHGETQYNAEERMTGRADIPLTSKGEEQGRAVGAVVKHFEIDVLYASPLQRAFNTMVLALESAGGAHNHLKNADGTWNINQRDSLKEKYLSLSYLQVFPKDIDILLRDLSPSRTYFGNNLFLQ